MLAQILLALIIFESGIWGSYGEAPKAEPAVKPPTADVKPPVAPPNSSAVKSPEVTDKSSAPTANGTADAKKSTPTANGSGDAAKKPAPNTAAPAVDKSQEWKDNKCPGNFPTNGLDLAKRVRTLNEFCFIAAVWHTYSECRQLTGKVNASPEIQIKDTNAKKVVYHPLLTTNHPELKRTLVGLLCLLFVLKNEYTKFTEDQNGKTGPKMTQEQFKALKTYTESILKTDKDVEAIIVYTLINDLGKVQEMVDHYKTFATKDDTWDHDVILFNILKTRPDLIPAYKALGSNYQKWIRLGMSTGLNFPQMVQGESVPGSLMGVEQMHKNTRSTSDAKRAMELFIVHALYDVAGAAGGFFINGSFMMSSPVWMKYESGIKALGEFQNSKMKQLVGRMNSKDSPKSKSVEVYREYLKAVNNHTFHVDHSEWKSLEVQPDAERAILRIACLCRIEGKTDAKLVMNVIKDLDKEKIKIDKVEVTKRRFLVDQLDATGVGEDKATLLYYSPGLCANLKGSKELEKDGQYIKVTLDKMIELFQAALPLRNHMKKSGQSSVYTLDITAIANEAAKIAKANGKADAFQAIKFKIDNHNTEGKVVVVNE